MHLGVRAYVCMAAIPTSMASIHHRWMFMQGRAFGKGLSRTKLQWLIIIWIHRYEGLGILFFIHVR
jgi:hypothetical protein